MPVTVLLGTQRSGTNLLLSLLGSHPGVCAVPEVFNNSYRSRPLMPPGLPYFWEFLAGCARDDPTSVDGDHRAGLLDRYFDCIEARVGDREKRILVKVMYNSLHLGDGVWREPCERPQMLGWFGVRGMSILHLVRNDHLAAAISLFRAQTTGVYQAFDGDEVPAITFRIDPATLISRLQCMRQNQIQTEEWLQGDGLDVYTVSYESLFDGKPGSDIRQDTLAGIAAFLDIDPCGFSPVPLTRKLSPDSYRLELTNFDEIEKALRGTGYHANLVG